MITRKTIVFAWLYGYVAGINGKRMWLNQTHDEAHNRQLYWAFSDFAPACDLGITELAFMQYVDEFTKSLK